MPGESMAIANGKVEIRTATSGDIDTLSLLGRATFAETYGPFNTPLDLARHLGQTYSPAVIRENFEDDSQAYLIAQVDRAPAGFGLLRSGPFPDAILGKSPFKLQQLYVLKTYQGLQLGSRLVEALVELAISKGGDVIWLTVWERADWACRFYQRVGFEAVGKVDFRLGSSNQTDILMTKTLR